jgi:hypothetical protein
VLKTAAKQNALIAGHDVLGAVAVMHVEIHDGDPVQAVVVQGVVGGDGQVVEEAEAHGLVAGGAVPLWGGDVAKRVNYLEQGGSVWVFKLHK